MGPRGFFVLFCVCFVQGCRWVAVCLVPVRALCVRACIRRSPALGLRQLRALLPPFPVSRPLRGLSPATHRGGGSGSGFSPGPTHLGPVLTPLHSHQGSSRESPFSTPGRGEFP